MWFSSFFFAFLSFPLVFLCVSVFFFGFSLFFLRFSSSGSHPGVSGEFRRVPGRPRGAFSAVFAPKRPKPPGGGRGLVASVEHANAVIMSLRSFLGYG